MQENVVELYLAESCLYHHNSLYPIGLCSISLNVRPTKMMIFFSHGCLFKNINMW